MPNQWFSGDVVANGIKIHYHRTGGSKPPVVVAHGITDNGLCWTRLAQAIEQEFDVIMPDARGHGRSDAPQEGYTYEDMAADLAGLVRALGLEKPGLIGHSMGASTVATTAANYPDLAHCAVLEDPPWRSDILFGAEEQRAAMMEQWRANILELQSLSREEVIAHCQAENPRWSEVECGPWADSTLQSNPNLFKLLSTPPPAWQDTVRRIACPVLLITADPDMGAIITPEIAQEATRTWREGKVVHIPGAGHSIRRESFQPYVDAVTAFLRQD
jgi:pimeloyl-ACP methyl ester carboxylesterase